MKKSIIAKIENFFLKPASPLPIALLRIGLAVVLLIQAYLLRQSALDFLGRDGFIQGDLARYLGPVNTPQVYWFSQFFSRFGFSETSCIYGICLTYVFALICFGIGFCTRLMSILVWFLHWTMTNTGFSSIYGLDQYAHVFLFYLMWMPAGAQISVDALIRPGIKKASSVARLGLRILQIHLCITYLFSGIEKAQGEQWWNGELLWRAFTLPVYHCFDMSWIAYWPFLSKLGGWTALFFELTYFVMIWPKATRKIWVFAIICLHLGIAAFLGLELFGIIMCILTLCVFGVSAEPREIFSAEESGLRFESLRA